MLFQTAFHRVFYFSHKRLTFALTPESGYTLGLRRKIAHNGLHAETGAFLPSATAWLCAASEIHFIPPCFYIHTFPGSLWTTISNSSISDHLSSRFSTSRTNGPRSLSRLKAGTHSAFGEGSHTAAYTAKQGHSLPRPQCGFALLVNSFLFRHAFIYIHFPVHCEPPLSATALPQTIFHRVFQLLQQMAHVRFCG